MKTVLLTKLKEIWDKIESLHKEGKIEEADVLRKEEEKLRNSCIHKYDNRTNAIELCIFHDAKLNISVSFYYCPICCVYRKYLNSYPNINLTQEEIDDIRKNYSDK